MAKISSDPVDFFFFFLVHLREMFSLSWIAIKGMERKREREKREERESQVKWFISETPVGGT